MRIRSYPWMVMLVVAAFSLAGQVGAQGIVIPGAGPVNRSMAGTGVAAPLDAAGALLLNPASISGLESSEFVVSVELLSITTHLASTVPTAGGPFSGETRSDSGVNGLPTVAVAFRPEDSDWSYGLGLFAIGGFGQNYPGDLTNPILTPPPPVGAGIGPVYSKLSVLQLSPTISRKLGDRLSIGFAPTVVISEAALDPDPLATPTAPFTYPAATHARTHWGLGFQAGIYYETDCHWRLGASYKSPQWIEDFTFFSSPASTLSLAADYPGIISVGAAYYGLPRTVWAIDFRYVDYDNTELFGHGTGYTAAGSWTGLGWKSVFSFSTAAQYELNDRLSFRMGYFFTDNPIDDADTFFNLASSAVYQHILSLGATWNVTCRTSFSIAYLRAFDNSIEGPWQVPGAVPGTSVPFAGTSIKARQSVDALVAGLQVRF